nr:uncharacterized protein LOC106039706 [Anser cygnoides]
MEKISVPPATQRKLRFPWDAALMRRRRRRRVGKGLARFLSFALYFLQEETIKKKKKKRQTRRQRGVGGAQPLPCQMTELLAAEQDLCAPSCATRPRWAMAAKPHAHRESQSNSEPWFKAGHGGRARTGWRRRTSWGSGWSTKCFQGARAVELSPAGRDATQTDDACTLAKASPAVPRSHATPTVGICSCRPGIALLPCPCGAGVERTCMPGWLPAPGSSFPGASGSRRRTQEQRHGEGPRGANTCAHTQVMLCRARHCASARDLIPPQVPQRARGSFVLPSWHLITIARRSFWVGLPPAYFKLRPLDRRNSL